MPSIAERQAAIAPIVAELEAIMQLPALQALPLARACFEYLRRTGRLVAPTVLETRHEIIDCGPLFPREFSLRARRRRHGSHSLYICPLYPEDAELHSFWSWLHGHTSAAGYACGAHLISLRPGLGETPRAWACIMLHEVLHAKRADEEGRIMMSGRPLPPAENAQRECEVRQFEHSLYEALGGFQYVWAVSDIALQLKLSNVGFRLPVGSAGLGKLLEPVLGPVTTSKLQRHRDMTVLLHASFMAADTWPKDWNIPFPTKEQVLKLYDEWFLQQQALQRPADT